MRPCRGVVYLSLLSTCLWPSLLSMANMKLARGKAEALSIPHFSGADPYMHISVNCVESGAFKQLWYIDPFNASFRLKPRYFRASPYCHHMNDTCLTMTPSLSLSLSLSQNNGSHDSPFSHKKHIFFCTLAILTNQATQCLHPKFCHALLFKWRYRNLCKFLSKVKKSFRWSSLSQAMSSWKVSLVPPLYPPTFMIHMFKNMEKRTFVICF